MYVFYETFRYVNYNKGFKSVSFYTHRVTVFTNVTPRLYEVFKARYGSKALSGNWQRNGGKLYVRETLRIARHNQYLPEHPYYNRAAFTDRATSRNFGLSIFTEIDSENGLRKTRRNNFID